MKLKKETDTLHKGKKELPQRDLRGLRRQTRFGDETKAAKGLPRHDLLAETRSKGESASAAKGRRSCHWIYLAIMTERRLKTALNGQEEGREGTSSALTLTRRLILLHAYYAYMVPLNDKKAYTPTHSELLRAATNVWIPLLPPPRLPPPLPSPPYKLGASPRDVA